MTRRALILVVAGGAVGVLVGLGLLADGQVGLGLFFLVGPPVMSTVNLFVIRQSLGRQQLGVPRRRGLLTGRSLVPVPVPPLGAEHSWTGGVSVATDLGRMNASGPLAVLSLTEHMLLLRLRPGVIGGLVGAGQSSWRLDELLAVYPVRGRWFRSSYGIAVEATSSPLVYFWTRRPAEVLTVLAHKGLPVDWRERNITLQP